jgi:hypothetical protein
MDVVLVEGISVTGVRGGGLALGLPFVLEPYGYGLDFPGRYVSLGEMMRRRWRRTFRRPWREPRGPL